MPHMIFNLNLYYLIGTKAGERFVIDQRLGKGKAERQAIRLRASGLWESVEVEWAAGMSRGEFKASLASARNAHCREEADAAFTRYAEQGGGLSAPVATKKPPGSL